MEKIDPKILEITPGHIAGFNATLISYNKNEYDISASITEVSIYESIFSPVLYGDMVIIDMSAMMSILPIIGQEQIVLSWERSGVLITHTFYITDIYDVTKISENTMGYGVSLTSSKQMLNSVSLFSRSYNGRGDEIISKIHNEFLQEDIEIDMVCRSSHNVVFPFIKPLAAINMILNNVLGDDGTPMVLYDSLYGNTTKLTSYKKMFEQEPIMTLMPGRNANMDTIAGNPNIDLSIGKVSEYSIPRAYNTLEFLSKGSYGSSTVSVDLTSKRSPVINDFDFRVHAPSNAKDNLSDFYSINNYRLAGQSNLNDIRTTKLHYQPKNTYAFNDSFPNINTTDENTKAIIASYLERIQTSMMSVYMDSVPLIQAGKTVSFNFPRVSPKLYSDQDDTLDKVNSGKYLISSIRHYIKNRNYTMSVELMRNGMGDDAEFYTSDTVRVRETIRNNVEVYNNNNNNIDDNIRDRIEMETKVERIIDK